MLWYAGYKPLELYDKRIQGENALEIDSMGLTCDLCPTQAYKRSVFGFGIYKILDTSDRALKMDIEALNSLYSRGLKTCGIIYGADAESDASDFDVTEMYRGIRNELMAEGFNRVDVMIRGIHSYSNYLTFPDAPYQLFKHEMP